MRCVILVSSFLTLMAGAMSARADDVLLHAAGSLRPPLQEVAQAFEAATGARVKATFGASGTLKDRIAGGEKAEVFASANMEHPIALHRAGKSSPVVLFAQNQLCALARAGVAVSQSTLIDRLLEPSIRVASSTPKADPSGDYAWEAFRKIDALRPGAFVTLEKKALTLVGGPTSAPPPMDRVVYGALLAENKADIFLAYCTLAKVAVVENPGQTLIELPQAIAVGADYGLTVMDGAAPAAYRLAMFILSPEGQAILARHGFRTPTRPQGS